MKGRLMRGGLKWVGIGSHLSLVIAISHYWCLEQGCEPRNTSPLPREPAVLPPSPAPTNNCSLCTASPPPLLAACPPRPRRACKQPVAPNNIIQTSQGKDECCGGLKHAQNLPWLLRA
jgi:hypothetical protein